MKISTISRLLILLALVFTYSCSGTEEEPNTPSNPMEMEPEDELTDPAPTFSLETTEGLVIETSQFEGKNLVIFFFGFNCPPCRAIGPDVESKLHQAFKDNEQFAIIGADQWEGNNAGVDNFQLSTDITFPLGVKGAAMARDFGTTYDRLVIVNTEGEIVFRGSGIVANHLDEAIEVVQDLLN